MARVFAIDAALVGDLEKIFIDPSSDGEIGFSEDETVRTAQSFRPFQFSQPYRPNGFDHDIVAVEMVGGLNYNVGFGGQVHFQDDGIFDYFTDLAKAEICDDFGVQVFGIELVDGKTVIRASKWNDEGFKNVRARFLPLMLEKVMEEEGIADEMKSKMLSSPMTFIRQGMVVIAFEDLIRAILFPEYSKAAEDLMLKPGNLVEKLAGHEVWEKFQQRDNPHLNYMVRQLAGAFYGFCLMLDMDIDEFSSAIVIEEVDGTTFVSNVFVPIDQGLGRLGDVNEGETQIVYGLTRFKESALRVIERPPMSSDWIEKVPTTALQRELGIG